MPHPKRKLSKSRRDKRRTHYKAKASSMHTCPQCGAAKMTHTACPECGYYNGRKVLTSV